VEKKLKYHDDNIDDAVWRILFCKGQ